MTSDVTRRIAKVPLVKSVAAPHQSALRTALAGLIGNVLEWFDFAVYGYFASDIGRQFFPQIECRSQQLLAFAVFAIGLFARPIGGLTLGVIGDRIGRRALLTLSIALMGGSTLIPAKSTIHAVLDRHGLVERRGRVRRRAQGTALSLGQKPNELWCTDYKGEFLLDNRQYCYPLTVTDHASRFLLTCEALSSTKEDYAFTVFERLFKERGLPANIRSDNGVPFASAHALFNLSKLAVWWLRLGIGIERIKPGHPQQNGRHERCPISIILFTTRSSSLPVVGASAWAAKN